MLIEVRFKEGLERERSGILWQVSEGFERFSDRFQRGL